MHSRQFLRYALKRKVTGYIQGDSAVVAYLGRNAIAQICDQDERSTTHGDRHRRGRAFDVNCAVFKI
jgi:hypothetical protein